MLNETEHVPWIALNKNVPARWLHDYHLWFHLCNLWWADNELCIIFQFHLLPIFVSSIVSVYVMQLPPNCVREFDGGDKYPSAWLSYWESLTGMILQSFRPESAVLDWPILVVGLATNNLQASYVLELKQKLTNMDMSWLFQSCREFIHVQHTRNMW